MLSARTLRITLTVLAVIGLGWATYLTYVHYSGEAPVCSIKGNPCSQVQKSVYSELAGVPVALIGAIGYLVILGTLLAFDGERGRFATVALTLGGFGFSLYLTYREVFTLHKICEDCVASAVIMTILMCLSVWRFLRGDGALGAPLAGVGPPAQGAEMDTAAPLSTAS
jgi:uncharacterized membrane protein